MIPLQQVVPVDEEMVNLIQGLQYEVNSRQAIITNILTTPGSSINKELFDEYQNDLSKYTTQYELAKSNLERLYMPYCYKDTNLMLNWSLDFIDRTVTFTVSDPDSITLNSHPKIVTDVNKDV